MQTYEKYLKGALFFMNYLHNKPQYANFANNNSIIIYRMKELLLVSIGSFFGGGLRFLVGKWLSQWLIMSFPWGTFAVNVVGCFLIGIFSSLSLGGHLSPNLKLLLATGLCGGFTTFSTFMNENLTLANGSQMLTALLYTAASLLLGAVAVWGGYALAR